MTVTLREVIKQETPGSILRERKDDSTLIHKREFFIGDRPRVSTCSDVVWTRQNTLITCNLGGQAIHLFDYREGVEHLVHRQTIRSPYRLGGLALSPDGKWLAVTHSMPGFRVAIHAVGEDGSIEPNARRESAVLGKMFVHGVDFSPDGRFLFVTQFEVNSTIVTLDPLTLRIVRELPTPFVDPQPKFAKSACFTHDRRFMFIAYSARAQSSSRTTEALIAVHNYSVQDGVISAHQCLFDEGLGNVECLDMLPDGTILAVDQYESTVFTLSFDQAAMKLTRLNTVLSEKDGLRSPHGISVADHGAIAVTDHIDDVVRIYVPA